MSAVNGMKNDKSPGANGIPAEAIKSMNKTNRWTSIMKTGKGILIRWMIFA
jgi:hypothetical protein